MTISLDGGWMEILKNPTVLGVAALVLAFFILQYFLTRFFDRRSIAGEVEEMGGKLIKISREWFPYAMLSEPTDSESSMFGGRSSRPRRRSQPLSLIHI